MLEATLWVLDWVSDVIMIFGGLSPQFLTIWSHSLNSNRNSPKNNQLIVVPTTTIINIHQCQPRNFHLIQWTLLHSEPPADRPKLSPRQQLAQPWWRETMACPGLPRTTLLFGCLMKNLRWKIRKMEVSTPKKWDENSPKRGLKPKKIQVFVPQKWRYSVTGRRGATSPGRCRWRAGPPHSTRGSPVGAAQNPCEAADGVAGIGHCPMTNGVVVKCYFKDLKRLVIYPLVNVYITNWKDPPFLMGIGFVYQGVLGLEQSWL